MGREKEAKKGIEQETQERKSKHKEEPKKTYAHLSRNFKFCFVLFFLNDHKKGKPGS